MALDFNLGQVAMIQPGTTPQAIPVALLTDLKEDFSYKEVGFRGPNQFLLENAFSEGDIKITAKNGNINGATLSALLAGSTLTAGGELGVYGELATIPATPFQVTVANGATYARDLGILDLTANKWLQRVAAAPATGQFMVNPVTGQYTFAAADTGHNLFINYSYTSATIGKTVALNNQLQGTTPQFALALYNAYNSQTGVRYHGLYFPRVTCPKLSMAKKPGAFTEQDLTFTVVQDSASALVVKAYTQE